MKIVAVMPLKLNNERLPGKNTKLLGGKPLLNYELDALLECKEINDIYVYCSDESVAKYLNNQIHFLPRPKALDLPTSNFTQIFESFMANVDADIYVYAHATAPFVTTQTIHELITSVTSGQHDSSFCATKMQDFLWQNGQPLNFDASNLPRSQDLMPIFRETSGVYVFTKDVFLTLHRRIGLNPFIKEVSIREAVDINTAEDFALAEQLLDYSPDKHTVSSQPSQCRNRIKVLDATLRDGGCVNDFNFGDSYIRQILMALESSSVDYIEVGYLDDTNGSETGRTKYISEKAIKDKLLIHKIPGTTYLAMMDYGKFNVSNLSPRTPESGIDGIRLAFHKKDRQSVLSIGRAILDKGYSLFIQPMLTLHYTDDELLDLINDVKVFLPETTAIYIVDSFGEMRSKDLRRIFELYESNVPSGMSIGLHSHNNIQLSYSLAMQLIGTPTTHELVIDASVMGMGKGAGNLCTELLLDHMNLIGKGRGYEISPLLTVIDKVLKVLQQETPWGYSPEFYLSSFHHCTPSYASYFYAKQMLPLEQVGELLGQISPAKAISFDAKYAEELYSKYRSESEVDDYASVEYISNTIKGKQVLLIAPGKSIIANSSKIKTYLSREDLVSISLNNFEFTTDFYLLTRTELLNNAKRKTGRCITTSRMANECRDSNLLLLSYYRWTLRHGAVVDSSAVIALNLISSIGTNKILLAGFDGFSVDINNNYFEKSMRHPISNKQAQERNMFYSKLISSLKAKTTIEFITPSIYNAP